MSTSFGPLKQVDHVAIVIRNYRWRIGAIGEPHYDDLERQLAAFPAIAAPAINCA
jgi:hypothetical protein